MADGCDKLYRRSVDVANANGNWRELWSEWNEDATDGSWAENYRIETMNSLSNMYVSLTHDEFVDLAKEYGSSEPTLTLSLRIAFKAVSGTVLAEDPFTLKFTDSAKVSECAAATLAYESVTRNLDLAFVEDQEAQDFSIPRAMRTKFAPEFKNCSATYQLYAFDEELGAYKPWEDVIKYVKSQVSGTIYSYIDFNQNTADIGGTIYKSDVALFREHFRDDTGDRMKF
jgi:hypothetical protein